MLPRFEQFVGERQYLTNLSSTVTLLALFNSARILVSNCASSVSGFSTSFGGM